MSKFGVQPARQALFDERWSVSKAAQQINESKEHLSRAVRGYVAPSPRLRKKLPQLLGRPLADLFSSEALATSYQAAKARRAGTP